LDRYAYVNNSPLNFVDPSGHVACNDDGVCNANPQKNKPSQGGLPNGKGEGDGGDDGATSTESGNECDGSGLITQYCLDMDAGVAQELEGFLDKVNASLDIASALESSTALAIMIRGYLKLPVPQQVTILAALLAVSPPIAISLSVLAFESQIIGNDLNNISENLSDYNVTNTGGRLTISSNIFYDIYEVETPDGEIYTSYGFGSITFGGPPVSKSIIIAWALSQ
jgi:hypothetical protein